MSRIRRRLSYDSRRRSASNIRCCYLRNSLILCIKLEWASQNSCIQRKGRVGRVNEGFVYRMVSKRFYDE